MIDDCDDGVDRELPEVPAGDGDLAANPDDAILVESPTVKYALTARHDLDVHTAITQGLASYLVQLDGEFSGRSTKLTHVGVDWADYEDGSYALPSAVVHSEEVGVYRSDSGMGQGPALKVSDADPDDPGATRTGGDTKWVATLTSPAIYRLENLMIDVKCDSKIQRAGVRRMLEDGLAPVEWMSGFRIVLPRYHRAIAKFSVMGAQMGDTADGARAHLRPLTVRLLAECSVYVVRRLPLARPIVSGSIA